MGYISVPRPVALFLRLSMGFYNAPGILRSLFCLSLSTPNDW